MMIDELHFQNLDEIFVNFVVGIKQVGWTRVLKY